MEKENWKGLINYRIGRINKLLGVELVADHTKQGYLLYEWKDNCPCSTYPFTFTGGRLKPAEFYEYLDGMYNMLLAFKNEYVTIKQDSEL